MSLFRRFRRRRPHGGLVGLCRSLDQQGWQHLHAAEERGRGVVLVIAGDEQASARRAVAAWLAPAAGLDADGRTVAAPDDALADALEAGGRVALAGPEAVAQAARLIGRTHSAALPVVVDGRDARRMVVGAPVTDPDSEALERAIADALGGHGAAR